MLLEFERPFIHQACGWTHPEDGPLDRRLLVISKRGRDYETTLGMFAPTATATCIERRSKLGISEVLLIERSKDPYKNHFSFPGGRILSFRGILNEPIKSTAVREIREETGLDIDEFVLRLFLGYQYPQHNVAVFDISNPNLELRSFVPKAGADVASALWVTLRNINKFPLTPLVQECLPLLVSRRELPENLR